MNLVNKGTTSKVFMVGFISTVNPRAINDALRKIHDEIKVDQYLDSIPSISSSRMMFHANKDCAEVRERVFKALHEVDFGFQCIVARKKLSIFRNQYGLRPAELYKDLVSRFMKNRAHLNKEIDCYFSLMQNVVRCETMELAIKKATERFASAWGKEHDNSVRVIIQKSSELYSLQAVDYILWAVYQAFKHGKFRHYNYIRDKIDLIFDVFDFTSSIHGAYYSKKNPLTPKKMRPL